MPRRSSPASTARWCGCSACVTVPPTVFAMLALESEPVDRGFRLAAKKPANKESGKYVAGHEYQHGRCATCTHSTRSETAIARMFRVTHNRAAAYEPLPAIFPHYTGPSRAAERGWRGRDRALHDGLVRVFRAEGDAARRDREIERGHGAGPGRPADEHASPSWASRSPPAPCRALRD